MKRREFLKNSILVVVGASLPIAAMELIDPKELLAARPDLRWGFLVDTHKCVGCGFCVKACKKENGVPYDAKVTRTWVERYVVLKDGTVLADSPMGGRDGFTGKEIDRGVEAPVTVKDDDIAKAFFVPKLCNQCAKPPCVQVCPVGATFQTADGVVLVDRTWCIGCGYCIMACPYGVRFFHPVYHVADKCTFCYHRISKGMKTACVGACPFGARQIGNLRNPADPITRVIMNQRVGVLKDAFGTEPQVYYIGLSKEVR